MEVIPGESTLDRIQKRLPKEYKKPTLKDKAVRKPNAVPPKTRTIKMRDGGIAIKKRPENMAERIEITIYKYENHSYVFLLLFMSRKLCVDLLY